MTTLQVFELQFGVRLGVAVLDDDRGVERDASLLSLAARDVAGTGYHDRQASQSAIFAIRSTASSMRSLLTVRASLT